MDAWFHFISSYLCKRFVVRPTLDITNEQPSFKDIWIQSSVPSVCIYDIAKRELSAECIIDQKPTKKKSFSWDYKKDIEPLPHLTQNVKRIRWKEQDYKWLHSFQDKQEESLNLQSLDSHIYIFQDEKNDTLLNQISDVDETGNPSYPPLSPLHYLVFILVTNQNIPGHIIIVEQLEQYNLSSWSYLMNHFMNSVSLNNHPLFQSSTPQQTSKHHFGWSLLPYFMELRRYLSKVSSKLVTSDLNLIPFDFSEWNCSCKNTCCPARFRVKWFLHYIPTSLPYDKFLKSYIPPPRQEQKTTTLVKTSSTTCFEETDIIRLSSSVPTPAPAPAQAPAPAWNPVPNPPLFFPWFYPYYNHPQPPPPINRYTPIRKKRPAPPKKPEKSQKRKMIAKEVPESVSKIFEFIIQQLLLSSTTNNPLIPEHHDKKIANTEYDIVNRVWRWFQAYPETRKEIGNKSSVAMVVILTLKDMLKKKILKKSPYQFSTLLFPHLFPIRFSPHSIKQYIHETLVQFAFLQLAPSSDEDLHLTFYIKSNFDMNYPSFKGQTLSDLVLSVEGRAREEKRLDILKANLYQHVEDLIETDLVGTNCTFSLK